MKTSKKIEDKPEELLVGINQRFEMTKKNERSKIFNQGWNKNRIKKQIQ